MNDKKRNEEIFKAYEENIKREENRALKQSIVALIFSLVLIAVIFYAIKWSVIQVFLIWNIALTANQSTAVAFLFLYLYSGLTSGNKKRGK